MFGLGMQELVIVGIVAVLLFGKRLPEVARSVGVSYSEFRKGLNNIQSDLNVVSDTMSDSYSTATSTHPATPSYDDPDDREEATAPMFEPPAAEPAEESDEA